MSEKSEKKRIVVRTISAEIIRPIDRTWDDVGPLLRAQRNVVHRLINAAIVGCLDADRGLIKEDGKNVHVETHAYRSANAALKDFREWAEKSKDPQVRGLADVDFCGGTISSIAQIGTDFFKRWKKERGNVGLPSFKKGQPIPLRAQELEIGRDEKGVWFSYPLVGGKNKRVKFALVSSKGFHLKLLREIVSEENGHRALAAKIVYSKRAKKWFFTLSYERPKSELLLDPEKVLVVHRGMHNFAYLLSSDGRGSKIRGQKLMIMKRRLTERRKEVRSISACELGSGAKGRGSARRFKTADSLLEKERRVVDTFSKQTAARIRQLCFEWGCGTVVIGEYGGIKRDLESERDDRYVPKFPFHRLKTDIATALEPHSICLDEVDESYVSQICPRCGDQDSRARNIRTGVFHCRACDYDRECDRVSAVHMLRRFGKSETVDAMMEKEMRDAAKIRKGIEP